MHFFTFYVISCLLHCWCCAIINAAPSPEIMTTLFTVYWSMLITDVICIKWNQAAWIKSYSVKWILVSYDSGITFFYDYLSGDTMSTKLYAFYHSRLSNLAKIATNWGHINWIFAFPSWRIIHSTEFISRVLTTLVKDDSSLSWCQ